MPEYVWVKDTDGAEYAVVKSALDPEIHAEVAGAEVVVDAAGIPRRAQDPTGPAKSDPKQAWVDHAVSQGASPDEAEAATKADLIASYGKEN